MSNRSSRVEALWIKRFKRGPMDPKDTVLARKDLGLQSNADQGGKRQVTVIEKEVFDRISDELGSPVEPSWRRANIMVSGISLANSRGRVLNLGELRLKIMGETRPCERMDQACPGLQQALSSDWRGGIYGIILNDSHVKLGDGVSWEEDDQ